MGEKVIHGMSKEAQADLAAQQTLASQKAMSGEAAGGDDDGGDPPAEKAPGADFISYNSDGSIETIESGAGADDDDSNDDEQDGDDEQDDGADDGTEQEDQQASADDKSGDKPRKPKKSVQERINEMTRQRHEAERARDAATKRADALQSRLERIEQRLGVQGDDTSADQDPAPTTDADSEEGRPDPAKFDYGEIDPKYIEALSDWKVDQRLKQRDKERQQEAAKSKEEQEKEELREKYMGQIKKGMETYDDFEEVVVQGAANNTYPLSEDLGRLIADSEAGADIAYYLASHPDEAVSVYNMTPLGQARWFGATETRFTSTQDAPKTAPVSKAPKPVARQPRGSSGKFETPADTEDFSAFESRARKELNNG